MSYQAEYLGDANYPARTGACEPLTVTPVPAPAIAIVKNPKGQTVAVGGTAKFRITVTNAGNTVLTNVTVADPKTPSCNRTIGADPGPGLDGAGRLGDATPARGANVRAALRRTSRPRPARRPAGPNVTATDTAPVKVKALTPKKPVKKKPKVVVKKNPRTTG